MQTDRSATPWLIVLIHAPWYNTYSGHYKENDCMRQSYEWIMTKYNVDIMLFGHVHAYERTKPVKDYKVWGISLCCMQSRPLSGTAHKHYMRLTNLALYFRLNRPCPAQQHW